MNNNWVFDGQDQLHINECRKYFLGSLFQDLSSKIILKSVCDAGCGLGFFSQYLHTLKLKVLALDARKKNIEEAKNRYPEIEFQVENIENPNIAKLGQFDLVLCFGLLYHLENPFLAIRNLYAITGSILIIESIITPHKSTISTLVDESYGEDQGLNSAAFVSSESCLIKMLHRAGFSHVYKTNNLPDHKEFRESVLYKRRRTILLASKIELCSSLLQEAPTPITYPERMWDKKLLNLRSGLFRIVRSVRSIFPIPVKLPWGAWWLCRNDAMSGSIYRHNFEQGEQAFLCGFIQKGMTVIDIGAHHGYYTLLASRKVGQHGCVIGFEPSPREYCNLRRHIAINHCGNVRTEPVALNSYEGLTDLYICLGQETGCNSLRQPMVFEPVKKIKIQAVTLDGYIEKNKIEKIDIVKIDTEGAELEILKGAVKLLKLKSRPVILCELVDMRTKPWNYEAREIYEFLVNYRYQWFSITQEGYLYPAQRKDSYDENLVAVPCERLSQVSDLARS